MVEGIKLPVFVYETETGDITLYTEMNELRAMVEEFWDILEKDFKFWDKDGYPISFERSFLDKKDDAIIRNPRNEAKSLKLYLIKYAERKGVDIENSEFMSLLEIYDSV